MRFDPVGIWAARLRDAPAASAAEAILTALLGYRDSHLLHADDVAQLASALEAWGTLVLNGNRADGSPYVPPTEGERASAMASLKARVLVNASLKAPPADRLPLYDSMGNRLDGAGDAEDTADHTGAPDA